MNPPAPVTRIRAFFGIAFLSIRLNLFFRASLVVSGKGESLEYLGPQKFGARAALLFPNALLYHGSRGFGNFRMAISAFARLREFGCRFIDGHQLRIIVPGRVFGEMLVSCVL